MLYAMPTRPRGEDNFALCDSDRFRIDDLVGGALLKDAVLVDARRVREGVGSDDGLVRLDKDSRHGGNHAAGFVDFLRADVVLDAVVVEACGDCHYDLFQRGIAGALANAIDGTLNL